MVNKKKIVDDLRQMGVKENDTLYIRASLKALGRIEGDIYDVVVNGFLEAVAPNGTVMVPTFSKIQNIFSSDKTTLNYNLPPISGAISKVFLKHPDVIRSKHPSHSFAAIGPRAKELLDGHNEEASCFLPVKKLAAIDGKMLLLGCVNDSPGFSTIHVAQFDLGLSQQHYIRHLQQMQIVDKNEVQRKWKPIESPGCSLSFDKFYNAYITDENLNAGFVGKAYGLLVPSTAKALETETRILKKKNTFVNCGKADCLTCGFRGYQMWRIPFTAIAVVWKTVMKRLS